MIAEVKRDRSRAQLDKVFPQHRIGVQRRCRRRQCKRGNDHAAGLEQHGNIAWHPGAVGRDIGKAGLGGLAKNIVGPEDARRRGN
jgi:hypothetical protein